MRRCNEDEGSLEVDRGASLRVVKPWVIARLAGGTVYDRLALAEEWSYSM